MVKSLKRNFRKNTRKVEGTMRTRPLSISGAEEMEGIGGGDDKKDEQDFGIPSPEDALEDRSKLEELDELQETSTKQKRLLFPFAGVVGQEKMKLGLLLNAINPKIGGMLVQGEKGTAKSISVRGLAEILPEIDVVKGCRFNCSPHNRERLCFECKDKIAKGKTLSIITRPIKVVDLPLGATEDRVVGTMDIEKVLREGRRAFEPGILAEANQGILYVDEINLLDDYVVDVLLDAAAMGVATVEREGVSISHPAEFVIVGTMNPEEGELRPQLLDRLALTAEIKGERDIEIRTQIMINARKFFETPLRFRKEMEVDQNLIRSQVVIGRALQKQVEMDTKFQRVIAGICIDFNTDGHRSDIIIERAARTHSALRVAQEMVNQVQPYLIDAMEDKKQELIELRKRTLNPVEQQEVVERNMAEITADGESFSDLNEALGEAINLEISFKELISDKDILKVTQENIEREIETYPVEVDVDDIVTAAEMVLPHRMRSQPLEEEEFSYDLLLKLVEDKI